MNITGRARLIIPVDLISSALEKAIQSVRPSYFLSKCATLRENQLVITSHHKKAAVNLNKFTGVKIISFGKAAVEMSDFFSDLLGKQLSSGIVVAPSVPKHKKPRLAYFASDHPIPTKKSVRAASAVLEFAEKTRENELVLCLISGGGSALLSLPAYGLALEEKQRVHRALIECGAPIEEINCVRKHLSQVKGGWLAHALAPSAVISLVLSDVLSNDLSTIASGPTVPDETNFHDAKRVMQMHGLWKKFAGARQVIQEGLDGFRAENPKPHAACFLRAHSLILASNGTAVNAAAAFFERRQIEVKKIYCVRGDVNDAAKKFAALLNSGHSFVAGGEPTVVVRGKGKGGRNQELALRVAMRLTRKDVVFASIGTDGVDGVSNAAGAVVTGETLVLAKEKKLSAKKFLERNDSNSFFKKLGCGLITTGKTGTNAADVMIGRST